MNISGRTIREFECDIEYQDTEITVSGYYDEAEGFLEVTKVEPKIDQAGDPIGFWMLEEYLFDLMNQCSRGTI